MNRLLLVPLLSIALADAAQADEASPPAAAPTRIESREPLEESLRHSLAALSYFELEGNDPVPAPLARRIEAAQPRSGDFLLSMAADDRSALQRHAIKAIVSTWKTMSSEQISAYLRDAIRLDIALRPHYPEGFNVHARFSYAMRRGWSSFPDGGFKLQTRTTHLLDGRPYKETFHFSGPMATTGWLETGALERGEHVAAMRLEFEFDQDGKCGSGQVESAPFRVRIVDAAVPDDLDAARGEEEQGLLKAFFEFSDIPEAAPGVSDGQVGQESALRLPTWKLEAPLPFALCFEIEIQEKESGRVTRGGSVFIPAGQTSSGVFGPYYPALFVREHGGLAPVTIVLQPSYTLAMSEPAIQSFYGGRLEFNGHIYVAGPLKPIPPPW